MSKPIKLTKDIIRKMVSEFEDALSKLKMDVGKVSYSKDFPSTDKKAHLYFTEKAYLKMEMLIDKFDKEVGWHGLASRVTDEENAYLIEDIVIYPQEVTSVTVDTDPKELEKWLAGFDDETFRKIRFHGHSHVNMGTSPSGTDLKMYEGFLNQLDDTMFYVFAIWNKRGENTIKIYDLSINTLFEDKDIERTVLYDGENSVLRFIDEAPDFVKEHKYAGYDAKSYYKSDSNKSKEAVKEKPSGKCKKEPVVLSDISDDDDDWYSGRKSNASGGFWNHDQYYNNEFDDKYYDADDLLYDDIGNIYDRNGKLIEEVYPGSGKYGYGY